MQQLNAKKVKKKQREVQRGRQKAEREGRMEDDLKRAGERPAWVEGEVLQGVYPLLVKITYIWCFGKASLDHAVGTTSRATLAGCAERAVRVSHKGCGRYEARPGKRGRVEGCGVKVACRRCSGQVYRKHWLRVRKQKRGGSSVGMGISAVKTVPDCVHTTAK